MNRFFHHNKNFFLFFCCIIKNLIYLCSVGRAMKMAFPAPAQAELHLPIFVSSISQLLNRIQYSSRQDAESVPAQQRGKI